jgi:predicted ABC-type transport system involved in lysophospholipase L1 biosynthesis ATPase subunit
MRTLNVERGLTFLIVTHDISVGRKTDRIIRMLDGRVVDEEQLEVSDVRPRHTA